MRAPRAWLVLLALVVQLGCAPKSPPSAIPAGDDATVDFAFAKRRRVTERALASRAPMGSGGASPPATIRDRASASEPGTDGDTLQPTDGVRVRLLNVDTPEFGACFGAEATARLQELTPPGTAVRLVYDRDRLDRYGRTLAHLYLVADGRWVNRELVAGGFARVVLFEPNGARYDDLVDVEGTARRARTGLWSACPET